jgi:peptide/nickel transport system permease protein
VRAVRNLFVWFLLSVIGAHALAFVVIQILPDPAMVALGIDSTKNSARESFERANKPRTYLQTLADLGHADFGTTLDGVSVAEEIGRALLASIPRFLVAALLVVFVVFAISIAPEPTLRPVRYLSSLLSFFPPFLIAFVGLGLLVSTDATFVFAAKWGGWLLSAICLAVPSAALLGAQAADVTDRNLRRPFATTVRAMGASRFQQRLRLSRNLVMELTPTFEKLVTGLLTTALFVEPIFGQAGLGTTTLQAIRRTDTNLLLALVLLFALAVNVARLLSNLVRSSYGLQTQ